MRKHPVVWFYILAFGISWLGWIPLALGSHGVRPFDQPAFQSLLILPAVGPGLAAIIMVRVAQGKARVGELLRPLLKWRVGAIWFLLAIFGPLLLLIGGKALTALLGLPVTSTPPGTAGAFIAALVMALLSNTWEEIGWRGFALPRLQKEYSALVATLFVGVLWGLWHIPLFLWDGNPMAAYPFLPWLIGTIAQAFLYTWLYNSTGGSLLIVTLYHVALNAFGVIVPGVSQVAWAILSGAVAVLLVAVFGPAHLSRRERISAG